jgi:hypothetical protein
MSDGDSHVLHTTERTAVVEVPDEIAAEVALRISPDASPGTIRDMLKDHVRIETEYVTPDGQKVVDTIHDN